MTAPSRLAWGEIANPSFIRALCIALDHRWKPDHRFMLFTAYIDESDTHGKEPDMVMGAFLGTGRQWELFNRKLRKIQKEFGFKIFHAVDFRHRSGEFKGWRAENCEALILRLVALVRDELTEGIVTWFPYPAYRDEFLAKRPKKMPRTSQYAICFQAVLERCLHVAMKIKGKHALSLVVESGHPNWANAKEVFDERKARYRKIAGADALNDITFAKKEDKPELMVCDFLAYTFGIDYRNKKIGSPQYTDLTDAQPRKGESGLTFQDITPQYIHELIKEFENDKAEKHEDFLKRKQACLDAKKPSGGQAA